MSDDRILYEKKNRIAYITINRADAMNCLDVAMNARLLEVWTDFRDADDAWIAILTGAGDKAFSAGADLKAPRGDPDKARKVPFGGFVRGINIWKPIIAAINGYCLAGGLEMALACDIRICTENAQFGLPEVRWAIMPDSGGTARLPRALPQAVAMELILTAGRLSAQQALQYGLVTHVLANREKLMAKAEEIANAILNNGPVAVRVVKEAVVRSMDMPLEHALNMAQYMGRYVGTTEDAKEGPKAFAEKRTPRFQAR